ncbi:hypothetical protein FB645_004356 [Coemansia sp. IMI 203386]|nr:hypothetical protein FB645_004356 [Coemansia sp. IMI 203386]
MLLKSLRFFSASAKRKEQRADSHGDAAKDSREETSTNRIKVIKDPFGVTNADQPLSLAKDRSNHEQAKDQGTRTDKTLFLDSSASTNTLPTFPRISQQPEVASMQQHWAQTPPSFGSRLPWTLDIDSTDDLAAMRPPSALLPGFGASDTELGDSPVKRKPAVRREPLHRMPSLDPSESSRSSGTGQLTSDSLDEEMPPLSPFFSRIPNSDIIEARDAVRRASISRRNTLSTQPNTPAGIHQRLQPLKQRDTWCVPSMPPLVLPERNRQTRMSLSGAMDRWTGQLVREPETPSKRREDPLSLFALESALEEVEWLVNQEPPMSPIFDGYEFSPHAVSAKLEHIENRDFHVDVYSLLLQQPAVVVREITNGKLNDLLDPAADPDVIRALRHHRWVLRQLQSHTNKSSRQKTAMRAPTKLKTQNVGASRKSIQPILSFKVSTSGAIRPDKRVRAIDIDAMTEAYLPLVHAMYQANELPKIEARPTSTTSETSVATLAENTSVTPAIGRLARRSDLGSRISLTAAASTLPTASRGVPQRQQLRATTSVLNLRPNGSSGSDPGRSIQLLRRRSEIPVAKNQPTDKPAGLMRRQSALEPRAMGIGTPSPAQRIRSPPHAGFSIHSSLDSGNQPLRKFTSLSPRTSGLLSPSSSRMSLSSDCSYDSPLASRSTLVAGNRLNNRRELVRPAESPMVSLGRSASATLRPPSSSGSQRLPQRNSLQFLERRRAANGATATAPVTSWQQKQPQKPSIHSLHKQQVAAAANASSAASGIKSRLCLPTLSSPQSLAAVAAPFGSGPKSAPVRNAMAQEPASMPLGLLPMMRKRPTVGRKPDVRDLFFSSANDHLVLRPL